MIASKLILFFCFYLLLLFLDNSLGRKLLVELDENQKLFKDALDFGAAFGGLLGLLGSQWKQLLIQLVHAKRNVGLGRVQLARFNDSATTEDVGLAITDSYADKVAELVAIRTQDIGATQKYIDDSEILKNEIALTMIVEMDKIEQKFKEKNVRRKVKKAKENGLTDTDIKEILFAGFFDSGKGLLLIGARASLADALLSSFLDGMESILDETYPEKLGIIQYGNGQGGDGSVENSNSPGGGSSESYYPAIDPESDSNAGGPPNGPPNGPPSGPPSRDGDGNDDKDDDDDEDILEVVFEYEYEDEDDDEDEDEDGHVDSVDVASEEHGVDQEGDGVDPEEPGVDREGDGVDPEGAGVDSGGVSGGASGGASGGGNNDKVAEESRPDVFLATFYQLTYEGIDPVHSTELGVISSRGESPNSREESPDPRDEARDIASRHLRPIRTRLADFELDVSVFQNLEFGEIFQDSSLKIPSNYSNLSQVQKLEIRHRRLAHLENLMNRTIKLAENYEDIYSEDNPEYILTEANLLYFRNYDRNQLTSEGAIASPPKPDALKAFLDLSDNTNERRYLLTQYLWNGWYEIGKRYNNIRRTLDNMIRELQGYWDSEFETIKRENNFYGDDFYYDASENTFDDARE